MTPLLGTFARLQAAGGPEGFLLLLVLKATVVLLVGFLTVLCLRRASAAARHLAWGLTLAGLLVLPVLAVWAPEGGPTLTVASSSAEPATGESVARSVAVGGTAAGAAEPTAGASEAERPAAPGSGRAGSAVLSISQGWILPSLYLLGAGGLLLGLAAGALRARRLRRTARRLDDAPGWQELIASLRRTLAVRRRVTVVASDQTAVPLAWGVRRPTVLLPAAAEGWIEAQRRDVLLHELAHVARHDWLMQLVTRVACALYWFHPLVWGAARRLVLEAERACDDRVLAAGSDSCDYAERLLRVAGAARASRDPSYAAVAMARRSDLATRIQAILDGRVRRGALRGLPALALAATLLVPMGVVGTARLAQAESQPGSAAPTGPEAPPVERLSPLLRAAHDGDPAEVRRLLDEGADPNRVESLEEGSSDVQRSALGGAVRGGHREVVELLLERGARVDLIPHGDASPLMIAARHGHADLVGLLLENGADPNRVVEGDGTPLIAAARNGDAGLVRRLLDAGADPNTWVDGDESPLFHAVQSGDRETVRLLLDAGAAPNAEWPGDGNPLIVASGRGDEAMVDLLLAAGADPDRGAAGDGNALIRAAAVGDLEIVRLLVESGADVDRIVPGDENPLIQAAGAGHLEVARYLLEQGADPNVKVVIPPTEWRPEGDVRTPLSMARRNGHDAVVRLLEAHGAVE